MTTSRQCTSPLLVPSIPELHKLLYNKYLESEGNKQSFMERKSVIEIGKLLTRYHQNCENVRLDKKVYFYPCRGNLSVENTECKFFFNERKGIK